MSDQLQDKRVILAGFDSRGKRLAHWMAEQGAEVTIADARDAGGAADAILEFLTLPVAFALGQAPADLLDEADLLCFSGGQPVDGKAVEAAQRLGIPIKNDALFILDACPALVIGITGSVGKTTTAVLLSKMVEADGRRVWLSSDVQDNVLDNLDQIESGDVVILELNSFQLDVAQVSPDIAAVLNVTSSVDYYSSLKRYAAAKSNIFTHQAGDDMVILGADDLIASSFSEIAPAHKAYFSARQMISDGAFLLGKRLAVVGASSPSSTAKIVCEREEIRLLGESNLQNVLAACAVAGVAGVSVEAMRKAILEFGGVPHRLELVAEINGVRWINDSVACKPNRANAALLSFDEPSVLIVGGAQSDASWGEMANLAVERSRAVIAFGQHAESIAQVITHARRSRMHGRLAHIRVVQTLAEAVELASQLARRGDLVLLSPGTPCGEDYHDFEERGEHFRQLVGELKN